MARFTRLLLLPFLACITIPLAQAQQGVTYTYTGQPLNALFSFFGSQVYAGHPITVNLTVGVPLAPSTTIDCTSGATVSMNDSFDFVTTGAPPACSVTTDANSNIVAWNISTNLGYTGTLPGCRWMVTRSSVSPYDYVDSNNAGCGVGEIYAVTSAPGSWAPLTPAYMTTALLGVFTGGTIQFNKSLGTSLIDQLTTVLTDINNGTLGLACSDLQIFANHVKAQTGKAINPADATTILRYVEAIAAGLPCPSE